MPEEQLVGCRGLDALLDEFIGKHAVDNPASTAPA